MPAGIAVVSSITFLDDIAQFCVFFEDVAAPIETRCAPTGVNAPPLFLRVHFRAGETAADFSSDGVSFGPEVSFGHTLAELQGAQTLFIGAGTYAPQPSDTIEMERFDVVPDGCTP